MSGNTYRFDTLKVRAGYHPEEHNGAVSMPIYQTAAFDFGRQAKASLPAYRLYRLFHEISDFSGNIQRL